MQQFAYEGFEYDDSDDEGFDDDDDEYEGFEDDDSDEGFDDDDDEYEGFEDDDDEYEGFDDDDSDNEGFKSKKSKAAKAIEKSAKKTGKAIKRSKTGKAVSKSANKTGRAIKRSKAGKAISKANNAAKKAAKKADKKWGISKKAKAAAKRAAKFKRTVIDPELTRAQIQARNAMLQVEENTKAMQSTQKFAAQVKSSIEKQVQNPDLKMFNKININKKSTSLVFIAFAIFAIIIVFALSFFKYGSSHIDSMISKMNGESSSKSATNIFGYVTMIIVIIFAIVFFSVIFKGLVLKTDINKSHVMNTLTTVLTIGLPIVGITLMTITNLPLMMRTFENTIGYWWISGDKLQKLTQKLFGSNGNYNDYSIITTQLFEENFKYYLMSMKKDSEVKSDINLNRFRNVFMDDSYFDTNGKIKITVPNKDKPDEKTQDLYELLQMVSKKRSISFATWVSLSVVVTLYTSHLIGSTLG